MDVVSVADSVEITDTYPIIPSGIYTVVGVAGHRTFNVLRAKHFASGRRTIAVKVGTGWETFGFVSDAACQYPISVWKKLRGPIGPQNHPSEFETYARMLTEMICRGTRRFRGPGGTPHDYHLMLSGRCLRCERRLTTPESLAAGIGPECAKKSKGGQ